MSLTDYSAQSLLIFTAGNGKIPESINTFSLPAGWTCPGATLCLAKCDEHGLTEKPKDKQRGFRCFAASLEAVFKSAYFAHQHNWHLLKAARTRKGMGDLIKRSLYPDPKQARNTTHAWRLRQQLKTRIVRVHCAGDFYSEDYFLAWMDAARVEPSRLFYAYTKSLPFWIKHLDAIPKNFALIASKPCRDEALIDQHNLRFAEVVFTLDEAREKGLEIDHNFNDRIAWATRKNFALLIHGTQPAGTVAAKWQTHYKKLAEGKANPAATDDEETIRYLYQQEELAEAEFLVLRHDSAPASASEAGRLFENPGAGVWRVEAGIPSERETYTIEDFAPGQCVLLKFGNSVVLYRV